MIARRFSQIKYKKLIRLANSLKEFTTLLIDQSTTLEDKTTVIEVWKNIAIGELTEINLKLVAIDAQIVLLKAKDTQLTNAGITLNTKLNDLTTQVNSKLTELENRIIALEGG